MKPEEALNRAAAYCSRQERCVYDVECKLEAWNVDPDEFGAIIERLKKEKFIDEERYATFFVRDKFRFNGWGKVKIRWALKKKNVDPAAVAKALDVINPLEGVDIVDLNCGCPVPKVVNNLQGSAQLSDLDRMGRAIETIKKHSQKRYTSVKIRLGFSEKRHVEIARVCEEAGADFIAVHGRTRSGRFKAPVDYDAIAEVKRALKIPVIANGDIDSPQKARWVLEHTSCDGIMIGRAAIGRPWIFRMIKEGRDEVTPDMVAEAVLEHFDSMIEYYGAYGAILFRKHLHTYFRLGYEGAGSFRNRINRITDVDEMRREIEEFFVR